MKFKSRFTVVAGGLIGLFALSSIAWACTASVSVSLAQDMVTPRRSVALTGDTLRPGRVEVRWNSMTGPVLAEGSVAENAKTFAAEVTVPDVAPGVYYVVLISGNSVARAPLQVTAVSGAVYQDRATVSNDLWSSLTSQPASSVGVAASQQSRNNLGPGYLMGVGLVVFALTGLLSVLVVFRPKGAAAGHAGKAAR